MALNVEARVRGTSWTYKMFPVRDTELGRELAVPPAFPRSHEGKRRVESTKEADPMFSPDHWSLLPHGELLSM